MNIPTLRTDRLTLRAFTPADAGTMVTILNGEDVLQYFPAHNPPTVEGLRRWIDRTHQHWDQRRYGLWAVELHDTNQLIGRCGLNHLDETDEVEIDFILDRDHWGRGIATEAGAATLAYAFDVLGLTAITGLVHPENMASRNVLEKLGMQFIEEAEYFGMICRRYVRAQQKGSTS